MRVFRVIEEANAWRAFHECIQDIRARNAETDTDEVQSIIDDAVREVRSERAARAFPA